jgi:hypothetical protein
MNSLEQFSDKDFGICKILFRKGEELENVCLFASHTFSPLLPEYIYYYLKEIKKSNLSIVFISSSIISKSDLKKLSLLADLIVEKENKGTDFGAWCSVLRFLGYGKTFQSLYLCNDSVFGPLSPLEEIHRKFYSEDHDILGITDSYQGAGYHIQSFFIGLKKSVLTSEVWENFWAQMNFHKDKLKVIEYYEIGMTQQLINAGFKCLIWTNWAKEISFHDILKKVSKSEVLRHRWLNRALYEQKDIIRDINPSSFLWKELITRCQNPFIKRELFIYTNLYEEYEVENEWEDILRLNTNYPVWLVRLFLVQYFFFKLVKNSLKEATGLDISFRYIAIKPLTQVGTNPFEEIVLFKALHFLLEHSETQINLQLSVGLTELDKLGVKYFPLLISSEQTDLDVVCTLLYLTYEIGALDHDSLIKLKTRIKRVTNPVIIVPDAGSRAIVASLLSVRYDGIFLEKDFLFPTRNPVIMELFKNLFTSAGNTGLMLFQKPTLSMVVKDALKGENKSAFIVIRPGIADHMDIDKRFNTNYYGSREDYLQYIRIKEKYSLLYEETPLWYKKAGQIIKVFTGNKRIIWTDKGKKETYRPTAQDMIHWYYIQYEVLPSWYKKIGKMLIRKKNNLR